MLPLRAKHFPKRFTDKINFTDSCWLWTAATLSGYGKYRINGVTVSAHRFIYERVNGPIPDGFNVCHTCDVPTCVNPDHMFIGTQKENIHDKLTKGRQPYKLTYEQAQEIRRVYKRGSSGEFSLRGLAKKYGVAYSQISRIVRYESWGGEVNGAYSTSG